MAAAAAVAPQGLVAGTRAAGGRQCWKGAWPCGVRVKGGSNGVVRAISVRCAAQAIEREVVKAEGWGDAPQEDAFSGLQQVCAVLGTQWGDEGKGKLVDILAQRFDVVARCQVW
jgi:adenylosuccinate synthase